MGLLLMPTRDKFADWPDDAVDLAPEKIVALYESGFRGAMKDPEGREAFRESIKAAGGYADGADAAHAYGIAGAGEGKLSVPFVAAEKTYPGGMPGPAQTEPDCVSHGTKNGCLISWTVEIFQGKPDEVTGEVEGAPFVSALGIANGVLATEGNYGARGHSSGGANCEVVAKFPTSTGGLLLRQEYAEAGIDLTKYQGKLGAGWGGRGVPEALAAAGKKHQIRTATNLKGWEQVRDFLAAGYGVNTCSSLGFANKRDENGYSKQSGSWAHSQALIGFDDRPEIVKIYGGPLCLWLNSWGKWNSGPRRILGTNIDIPEGAYWTDAKHCDRCSLIAFSATNGWPAQKVSWLVNFPD